MSHKSRTVTSAGRVGGVPDYRYPGYISRARRIYHVLDEAHPGRDTPPVIVITVLTNNYFPYQVFPALIWSLFSCSDCSIRRDLHELIMRMIKVMKMIMRCWKDLIPVCDLLIYHYKVLARIADGIVPRSIFLLLPPGNWCNTVRWERRWRRLLTYFHEWNLKLPAV